MTAFALAKPAFETLPLFESEKAMQAALSMSPDLLQRPTDPSIHLLKAEFPINLGVSGVPTKALDHLMIRADGLPLLVECKRSRNPEAPGEVVAQILRYLHGFLKTTTPASLSHLYGPNAPASAWAGLPGRHAARQVRLVFVLDEAPIDLVVAVAALRLSGFDVDLVEFRCEQGDAGGAAYARFVPLDPIDRVGPWLLLPTDTIRCEDADLDELRGVCRAKLVPFPASGNFRVLKRPPRVDKHGKRHQVDPARRQGYVAVMPNIHMLEFTSNPYPPDPYKHSSVRPDGEKYRRWVGAAYHAWELFREEGIFRCPEDIEKLRARIIAASDPLSETKSLTSDLRNIVRDVLLDWHLYGLADVMTPNGKTEDSPSYIALPPSSGAGGKT